MTAKRDTLNTKAIRAAVTLRRGGLLEMTDEQIMAVWGSLSPADQAEYLKPASSKDATDDRNGSAATTPPQPQG